MQIKGMKLFSLASCLFSTFIATAGDMGVQAPIADSRGELSFSAGYYNAEVGRTQHIDIVDLVGNNYRVNKKNDGSYLVGVGYLVNGGNYSWLNMAYGVKAFYLGQTKVRGVVEQENIFTNLSYRYNLSHIPIYAMARAMIGPGSKSYAFTLDAGIGPNVMVTSSYDERSLDGGITIPDYAFYGHIKTKFSATAGVGVKFTNLINAAAIEIGYRFFYLGQGDLRPRTNEILNSLKTKDIYANAVVLTLSI
ncbi:MAG: hypothetical protein H0T84_08415 [Tatlockia sp.]|nr:hypothetical protein [Tatlockia sp.]